ncbi:MAG: glycosyl transferase [Nitrospirae bacterium CG_4_9_14_3_um_filter_53_35]|nr:MAG: glycosyl transferase [Nitrospirae bacterium CG2_30_53_67]PIS36643.1 MAG: glycosyl transferase [Nitrospirae bacterium CG08_land_8_20_14_0_20_52_24]PIV85661.1 MAG: glycosyl transferase [Nitrospirae bacterium CG17_big_fil_post_rev_8_21_14_2_50_50_9]PIW85054.1 MAG: glycosyl transferase [Nitrospirae bacterium CG_4_8_14_3_um_filter_50_41]PIX86398.1 MAG: glycosyl transferase [Nitrospirae bacterium CG_4_10_14_3_um_filter_53_41]PJA75436.1 MAG: glycosyl transferase [Nitrospirae bacterium CG_4_9_
MSDFYQTGAVATFHRLGKSDLVSLESKLLEASTTRGVTLVLPSLFSEIKGEALKEILSELSKVEYIREIVVTLGPATQDEFREARNFFSVLPQSTRVIWNNGPNIQALYETMQGYGLFPGEDGKGRSAWMAYGYIIAEGGSKIIALHDCDILTYSRELLGRLIFPVLSPHLDFEFCKGFYSRVSHKMNGRVTRLFVTPLIRALIKTVGRLDILHYYDSFRYPLAGEFSMLTDLARINRIPADWGLEVGVLAEIYRNCSVKRICQVELCENYDHKHQGLSPADPEKGLNKMAIDIAKNIFRTLSGEGIIFTPGFFNTLCATYLRIAQDTIARYHGDAIINGLEYDRHEEGTAVEVFTEAIRRAGEIITQDPLGPPQIPAWNRVFAAIPDFAERILEAVRTDNP